MKSYGMTRAIMFFIVGIVFIGIFVYKDIPMWSKEKDLYNVDFAEIGNRDHIEMDVDYVFDYCYEMYEKNTKTGKTTTKQVAFLVPKLVVMDDGTLNWNFFVVDVPKVQEPTYSKLVDEFWKWYETGDETKVAPIHLEGYTTKMKQQEIKYAYDVLKDYGYTEKEIDNILLTDYKVEIYTFTTSKVFLLIGGIFLGVGVIILVIMSIVGKSKKKAEAQAAASANANNGGYNPVYSTSNNGNYMGSGVNYDPNQGTPENTTNGYNYSQGTTYTEQTNAQPAEQQFTNSYGFSATPEQPANADDSQQTTYRGTSPDK